MVNLELCKKILNGNEKRLSEEQVRKIRDFLYQLARIEFMNFKVKNEHEKSGYLFKGFDG